MFCEIKAESDIIVTSSNAGKIIEHPAKQKIILLQTNILEDTSIRLQESMVLWNACIVHETFSERELIKMKVRTDDAKIIAHPECPENILNTDFIGQLLPTRFISTNESKRFIVATEPHIIHQMKKMSLRKNS